ncbi:hypothetical protein K505DRAFT_91362 [Melanomma pulvis-pyrius CBS 109.77]|uniref:S-adenosyl-L-methionine-dependent methyltransferase n=1 Tax=Melanomma pulvis-pyrius CBS 109.77 TaxID=1314802 RepID=A0A6A6X0G6_9PLEO|nr:hypothetical protein K505DRAFT_91362 [Melanomma pulvis-pyrius CBS 109.77]
MATSGDTERYIMEANEGELQRLANQHQVLKSAMGTLTVAPIDFSRPNLRILDSGTADGLWLRDVQATIAQPHAYVGTDIVQAFFPQPAPPGLSFHNQSITQDWPDDWQASFDYVHQRLTLAGAGQHPVKQCVSRLAGLVKPGGWVELVEADFTGDSSNGPAMQQFEAMMRNMLDKVGAGYAYATPLKSYLEDAGLVNVQEKSFDITYGAACPNAHVAKKGSAHLVTAATGLRDFTKSQVGNMDMSDQELESFPDEVRKEVESRGAHFKMLAVWAQKS